MLQANNRKREAEQWHEPKKFVKQETNGNVRLKRKKLPNKKHKQWGSWMTIESRIEMYPNCETWYKGVAEQAEREAAKEHMAKHTKIKEMQKKRTG